MKDRELLTVGKRAVPGWTMTKNELYEAACRKYEAWCMREDIIYDQPSQAESKVTKDMVRLRNVYKLDGKGRLRTPHPEFFYA